MKTLKRILFWSMLTFLWLNIFAVVNPISAQEIKISEWNSDTPYSNLMEATTENAPYVNKGELSAGKWAKLFNNTVNDLIGYLIRIFIVIGIATAFIGWYKIMTSDKEESIKEWIKLITYGIVWIIVMVSAAFIANKLVWNDSILQEYIQSQITDGWVSWAQLAKNIYENIIDPFIKIALYLVVWVLFIIMAIKVFTFITSTDDKAKKKAGWIILWTVVWIFIILWSNQVVESVMGKEEEILNMDPVTYDNRQWNILNFTSIPIVAQIINWAMGLSMLAVLILIIIQWYRMFTKPDDPKNRERLKKTLLYIIIWVLVIWASSVISHALIIK